jgi:serine/threonine protein kinase
VTDRLKIWGDKLLAEIYRTWYSDEKITYYFVQSLCAIAYLHEKDIAYNNYNFNNAALTRRLRVKLHAFDLAVKMRKDDINGDIA